MKNLLTKRFEKKSDYFSIKTIHIQKLEYGFQGNSLQRVNKRIRL